MWPTDYLNYEDKEGVYWFSSPFDALNNWSAHAVKVWGREFKTVEHAYHYAKFKDNHPDIANLVANAPSPWAAMKVERANSDSRHPNWNDMKVDILKQLCQLKWQQNEDVQEILKNTKKRTIYENSPFNSFWGTGKNGKGENTMGKIWMYIRSESEKIQGAIK